MEQIEFGFMACQSSEFNWLLVPVTSKQDECDCVKLEKKNIELDGWNGKLSPLLVAYKLPSCLIVELTSY